MVLAVVVFALLGTTAGVATGLLPGLHVNTVAALVIALQATLFDFAADLFAWAAPNLDDLAVIVAALIIGNVVAHTFLDYVPSIFLGAPEAETALSVLPGHRMLLQGRGLEAVRISAVGSGVAAALSILLIVPLALVMGSPVDAYDDIRPFLPLALVLVAAMLIVAEPPRRARTRARLVCYLPEGVLSEDEAPPRLSHLTPSQITGHDGAFLLRGRVAECGNDWVEVEDRGASVRVLVEGAVESPLTGDVALFVAPGGERAKTTALVQRGWALLVFMIAGGLGYFVLVTPIFPQDVFLFEALRGDPRTVAFLPLFTGLFGIPTLVVSLARTPRIPAQRLEPSATTLTLTAKTRAILSGSLAGAFVAWIPGVTAATATVLSKLFSGQRERGENGDEEFILSLSCVNTATALFTIVALFVLLRARSGGMVAIQSVAGSLVAQWEPLSPMPATLVLMLVAAAVAAAVSYHLTPFFGGLFARVANRVPYSKLVTTILLFLLVLILLFSGLGGLLVAAIATLVGLLPPIIGVRRVHLMGSLLVPLVLLLA